LPSAYDLVVNLITETLPEAERRRLLRDFAYASGWRPSYELSEGPLGEGIAKTHLVVEHGLEPSAVITFLEKSHRASELSTSDQDRLLAVSYNNLVDWHLYIDPERVTFCFNRVKPLFQESRRISRSDFDGLKNEAFEEIVGRRPNPNVQSLDQALINTIALWKRTLAAEMNYKVSNTSLSALFNSILFVRAIEDHYRRNRGIDSTEVLLKEWNKIKGKRGTIAEALQNSVRRLTGADLPQDLVNQRDLDVFASLNETIIQNLLLDFYRNKFAPYAYDFSVMSKHALSRIYERYTALLRLEESPQTTFFPRLPTEELNRKTGIIYTPQFIARFFARSIREQMPPKLFRQIRTVDPACGSGIFLRTLLELQCDPLQDGMGSEAISQAFLNTEGWDSDENATHATRLSLALLHLVLAGKLPNHINVRNVDSFRHYNQSSKLKGAFDAVITNPPFIPIQTQSEGLRDSVLSLIGQHAKGRLDSYLAFLWLGIDLLKPGGYGLFVLPHSFLLARSAREIRKKLTDECWIHCFADLSSIQVFEDVGTYVVLLVFQKKAPGLLAPNATIIRCQDFAGRALEDYLNNVRVETPFYSIYDVNQDVFAGDEWVILPKAESAIRSKLIEKSSLGDLAVIKEGLITGADEVFVIDSRLVPDGEEEIFKPFLPDRLMERYRTPQRTGKCVFYPFLQGRKLTEAELSDRFPKTMKYLLSRRAMLEQRKPVMKSQLEWWSPVRPRSPEVLFRPKIVTPHLVLSPRFSLDSSGRYAVSRTPYLYPKVTNAEPEILRFLVAILNSSICYWYISTHSHKVSRGYTMLEPDTLNRVPIPDPARTSSTVMQKLLSLVDNRINERPSTKDATDLEREIDDLVADIYGLTPSEKRSIIAG